jgi:hypothetical protein
MARRSARTRQRRLGVPQSASWRSRSRYVLVGCIGVPPAAREHVFVVYDYARPVRRAVGCMTPDAAIARFGVDQLFMSLSHGLCPDCAARDEQDGAQSPYDPDDPDQAIRLAIVELSRRGRTQANLEEGFPGLARPIAGDLRVLVRAGYLQTRGARGRRSFVATPRGLEAIRAYDKRLITPARLSFPGRHDPDWYKFLRRFGR